MTRTDDVDVVDELIPEAALHGFARALLGSVGVPEDQAGIVADVLVYADLRGVDSHGVHLLSLYLDRIASGDLAPKTEVTVVRDDGSTVLVDGGLGFGQPAGITAIDLAIERARTHGLATVAVTETTHMGALGYYTERAADAGVVALAFQNGPTIVPPFGGITPLFSTNPFSYALPTAAERTVVYDVATTTVAGNKLLLAKRRGDASIPAGWANDEHGRPTTDTEAASVRQLQWFGGHKGFGIAMLVEVMAGLLAGSCFGTTEHSRSTATGPDRVAKGCTFVTLDPERFLGDGEFARRVDQLVAEIRASAPADGVERVMVPGEREHELREQRRRDGVPVSAGLAEELDRRAEAAGVEPLGAGPRTTQATT